MIVDVDVCGDGYLRDVVDPLLIELAQLGHGVSQLLLQLFDFLSGVSVVEYFSHQHHNAEDECHQEEAVNQDPENVLIIVFVFALLKLGNDSILTALIFINWISQNRR